MLNEKRTKKDRVGKITSTMLCLVLIVFFVTGTMPRITDRDGSPFEDGPPPAPTAQGGASGWVNASCSEPGFGCQGLY